jgi:hypothetical protein
MRTDRRTDMTKLIVAFRNFANAPKNGYLNGCANKEHAGEGSVNWRNMWGGVEPCYIFPWLQYSNHLNKTNTCSKTNFSLTRVVSPSASIMEHNGTLRRRSTVQVFLLQLVVIQVVKKLPAFGIRTFVILFS